MLKAGLVVLGLLLALGAAAQAPNVTPQVATWLESNTEVDIRLKGVPTATNPSPTVRLVRGVRFDPPFAQNYIYSLPCWNTASVCPQVVGVTIQVFLTLPTGRSNVTRFTGMCGNASECVLPSFSGVQAKPGESYRFNYSRVKAIWNEPPSVGLALTSVR